MPLRLLAVLVALGCSSCEKLITDGALLEQVPPESCTPRSELDNWPVKVLFVVEKASGMCALDPPGSDPLRVDVCASLADRSGVTVSGRVRALSGFFQVNASRPNVSASIVTFSTLADATAFQAVASGPPLELPTLQNQLGTWSDLQGGLELAATRLSEDMEATPAELRPRTKYVVVLLSKGLPYPRCSTDDSLPVYASPSDPSGTWTDSDGFCNTGIGLQGELIPGFVAGSDRNQNAQLVAAVENIVALKAQFGVGDVRVHTALLWDSDTLSTCGACQTNFYGGAPGRGIARYTLQQLALHGQGTFIDPGSPQQLTLSTLDTAEFTTFCP